MSDRYTIIQDELELITEFLHQRLDPARAEEVYQRLERDPEFLELATPLLFAWSVKPEWERAENVAEAEKHWEEFTRRADFVHHRRRRIARRWWLLAIVTVSLTAAGLTLRDTLRDAWDNARNYAEVANTGEWTPLGDGTHVLMSPGARLRSRKVLVNGIRRVQLIGSAHFKVEPADRPENSMPAFQPFRIDTRAGYVYLDRGEVQISARGDTADVRMLRPTKRFFAGFIALPTQAFVRTPTLASQLELKETEAARLVRGAMATLTDSLPIHTRRRNQ